MKARSASKGTNRKLRVRRLLCFRRLGCIQTSLVIRVKNLRCSTGHEGCVGGVYGGGGTASPRIASQLATLNVTAQLYAD